MTLNDEQKGRLRVANALKAAILQAIDDITEAKELAKKLSLDIAPFDVMLVDLGKKEMAVTIALEEIGEEAA